MSDLVLGVLVGSDQEDRYISFKGSYNHQQAIKRPTRVPSDPDADDKHHTEQQHRSQTKPSQEFSSRQIRYRHEKLPFNNCRPLTDIPKINPALFARPGE
jgi:hypothetical protein